MVTTSASLCTQTGLHCLTIQVLNTRVCFIDIWYTPLTSVHYNLKHGLATLTESFSLLNLKQITSLVKVWIRSDVTNHTIPNTVHLPCATAGKNHFELVTASLNHILSMQMDSTSMTSTRISHFPTRWFVNSISSSTTYFSNMEIIVNQLQLYISKFTHCEQWWVQDSLWSNDPFAVATLVL